MFLWWCFCIFFGQGSSFVALPKSYAKSVDNTGVKRCLVYKCSPYTAHIHTDIKHFLYSTVFQDIRRVVFFCRGVSKLTHLIYLGLPFELWNFLIPTGGRHVSAFYFLFLTSCCVGAGPNRFIAEAQAWKSRLIWKLLLLPRHGSAW